MLNKNKLKGKILEKGLSVTKVANLLGVNQATLHRKLNGNSEFTRSEIQILRLALELNSQEMEAIFFAV